MRRTRGGLVTKADKAITIVAAASAACGLVVVAAPSMVVMGFVAWIVPGPALTAMPTIGCYSVTFAVGWFLLRHAHAAAGLAAGLAGMVAIAVALPRHINHPTQVYMTAAIARDHLPATPIAIGGDIAIRQDETPQANSKETHCDDLCLRLLYNGDANSVVTAPLDVTAAQKITMLEPRRWSIVRSSAPCPRLERPHDSQWKGWPPAGPDDGLEERVRERIGDGECLVSAPGDPASASIVIERSSFEIGGDTSEITRMSLTASPAFGERLVVSRREGDKMVEIGRRTHVRTRELASPLHAVPVGFENMFFDWARTSPNPETYDNVAVLQRMVAFRPELPAGLSADSLRRSLAKALVDRTLVRGDPRFDLAGRVFSDVASRGLQPGDSALIMAALRDRRVMDFAHSWDIVSVLGDDALQLREILLERLRDLPYEYEVRATADRFDGVAKHMPAGAYRQPSPLLLSLLADPQRRRWMDDTIVRLADGGAAAVPLLLGIVEDSLARADAKSRDYDLYEDTRAAAVALCRIGAGASTALPTLDKMAGTAAAAGLPRGDHWVVTQLRLGRTLEALSQPANVRGPWRERVRHMAERAECQ